MQGNPIHIINVSIQSADTEEDDALVTELTAYTQSKVPPPSTLTTPSHPPSVCVLPLCGGVRLGGEFPSLAPGSDRMDFVSTESSAL